jgi:hypothetical protein
LGLSNPSAFELESAVDGVRDAWLEVGLPPEVAELEHAAVAARASAVAAARMRRRVITGIRDFPVGVGSSNPA